MRALVVANSNDADPGFVGERFRHHGYAFSEAHREYPAEWPELPGHDLILLLGSEWSVYWDDISGEVAAETALVQAAHQAGIPIFGICFGSQMVAHALGGRVHQATRPEVGWHQVESTFPQVIASGPWLQWHFDAFESPPSSPNWPTVSRVHRPSWADAPLPASSIPRPPNRCWRAGPRAGAPTKSAVSG